MKSDVSGSISGYYKQIYLAVRELLKLENSSEYVGVECGADIRVFKNNQKKTSIEVKFLKKSLGLYNSEFYKTIYNFYEQTSQDEKLIMIINSKSPNELYFEKQGAVYKLRKNKAVEYILHLLVKKELNSLNMTIKKLDPSLHCRNCKNNKCQNCINNFVNKGLLNFPVGFKNTIKFKNSEEVRDFAEKIEFVFENQDKVQSILNLKSEVKQLLIKKYKKQLNNFDSVSIDSIIHKATMELFDSTVVNSLLGKSDELYSKHKKLSLKDLETYIENYQLFLDEYKNDILDFKINEVLEDLKLNQEDIIKNFKKQHLDYIEVKKEYKIINEISINQYVKDKKKIFKDKTDLENYSFNLIYYDKGFGLIKYITSLNVAELHVYNDRVYITGWNKKKIYIMNDDFYDFEKIVTFLKENYRDSNSFFKYSTINDCSYLLSDTENVNPQTILIRKSGGTSSPINYHSHSQVPIEVLNKIVNIINAKKNILILTRMNNVIGKMKLYNFMISNKSLKESVVIFYEDFSSLPLTNKDVATIPIDTLDNLNIKHSKDDISDFGKKYDKVFLLLDNYEIDDTKKAFGIKKFKSYKGSLTTTWHCNSSSLINLSFLEISEKLKMDREIVNIFDVFIVLDDKIVDGEYKEDVRIIEKSKLKT